jgi:hypothetical protein
MSAVHDRGHTKLFMSDVRDRGHTKLFISSCTLQWTHQICTSQRIHQSIYEQLYMTGDTPNCL